MPRNMIAANIKLFQLLIDRVRKSDHRSINLGGIRWLRTDDAEKSWLKDLNVIERQTLSRSTIAAIIEFHGENYFVVSGFATAPAMRPALEGTEMNSGLFTALVSALDIPIRKHANPLEIIENVLPSHKGMEGGYDGHAFSDVSNFFENIAVFRIPSDSPFSTLDIFRISCFWNICNQESIMLPFSRETLEALEKLLFEGAPTLPSQNLLDSLQSAYWQHAYLEAYRAVERLFSLQSIEELHRELSIGVPLLDFSAKIEDALGWRPKDEEAMEGLFKFTAATSTVLFEKVKSELGGSADEKIARWVYRLRNSIVHFRPAAKNFSLADRQWDDVLRATFILVGEVYKKYDAQLKAA